MLDYPAPNIQYVELLECCFCPHDQRQFSPLILPPRDFEGVVSQI